jgi:hypothetical protein
MKKFENISLTIIIVPLALSPLCLLLLVRLGGYIVGHLIDKNLLSTINKNAY